MRQVTATEKYRAVNEGKMAKSEFVRQMRQQFPHFVSNYDGFDSTVKVLKYKGIIYEAKVQEQTGQKVYDERPALTYSLDALDRGVRAELTVLGLDPAIDFISKENLEKATNKAKDNLEKDANHYLNLMSGESNKVDKHDREKEVKRGAADKDTFNDMKKATLKENMYIDDEEWEAEMGRSPEDTKKAIDKEASKMSEDAKKNLLGKVVGALRAKYPEITAGVVKDFIKTHYQDLLDGADIEDEFEQYIQHNYDLMEKYDREEEDGHVGTNTDDDFEREQLAQLAQRRVNEYRGVEDDIRAIIRDKAADSGFDEQEEAMEVMEFIGQEYDIDFEFGAGPSRQAEAKGKDHDGDGDIDSDDYLAAKDKAIKKAMGKDEQLKEAIKSIIKKTLNEDVLNEAATVKLADWAEGYESFPGVKPVVNELENIVTEIETFYDKMSDKIAKVFEKTAGFENEEGLKIGGFIAPGLESAFRQDLSKVIKKGSFFSKVELPKVRTITQADIDAHNSGERPLGEQEPEKATLFTPVNENEK